MIEDWSLPEEGVQLDEVLGTVEKHMLKQALDQSQNHKGKAAKALGLTFRSFRYRLSKHGMAGDETDDPLKNAADV